MKKKDNKHQEEDQALEPKLKEKPTLSVDSQKKEEKSYEALWDKYLRMQAEFDNYKKRSYREKLEFVKYANEGLILELLEILDNFERGIKAADQKKDFSLLHQGVDMISRQLHSLLESKGLKRIKAMGEKFDPHQHEAIEVIEAEDAEDDKITEELQAGYLLNGRIVRLAKVKVVKAKEVKKEEVKEEIEEVVEEEIEKQEGIDKIEK
jgi:molecular chaperone GrpE